MPKFVIRGADKPEEIVEFWLTQSNGRVWLWAGVSGRSLTFAAIEPDGALRRIPITMPTGIPGLQYDDKGRIKEVE